ncbi:DUF3515 domain-containing protein [Actinorugispora endophytica]|uniref:Uncharacterized protein DUF3515 n=1 Tax=Actinorugispora endophytica TaxID=1605990 RepID=A0A4R6V1E2_9ACTN|nr:DUF3515 domain-containing protein [Actinorugispora endophytica]TDQ53664.1 uncharacterized protein DUF3515 [Actinorugispora endophytica]
MRRALRAAAGPAGRAAAALAAGLLLLSGCGAVRMQPPEPDERTAGLCRALVDRLPETLYEQDRVAVQPDSDLVAAWGSPTIALRCGVERPEGLLPDSQLTVVGEVAWLGEPADSPSLYTAVGREAYVELTLPATYTPPALALATISGLVEEEVPALPAGEL